MDSSSKMATERQIGFIQNLYQPDELKGICMETLGRKEASDLITKGLEKRDKEGEKLGNILQEDQ